MFLVLLANVVMYILQTVTKMYARVQLFLIAAEGTIGNSTSSWRLPRLPAA